jgi:hypothetical protein
VLGVEVNRTVILKIMMGKKSWLLDLFESIS